MRLLGYAGLVIAVLVGGATLFVSCGFMNRGVVRELLAEPNGEKAAKVMLMTLPSGKQLPVNYWRDPNEEAGSFVYAAADFPWWKELQGEGHRVTLWIRGETYVGTGRAILDEPEKRSRVFAQLRPTAPSFTGTMVEFGLDPPK